MDLSQLRGGEASISSASLPRVTAAQLYFTLYPGHLKLVQATTPEAISMISRLLTMFVSLETELWRTCTEREVPPSNAIWRAMATRPTIMNTNSDGVSDSHHRAHSPSITIQYVMGVGDSLIRALGS